MYGRVVANTVELRTFVGEAVDDLYRYALALTVSSKRAEQLTANTVVRFAEHVEMVGASPVSAARLMLAVRREVLDSRPREHSRFGRRRLAPRPETSPDARGSDVLEALASLDTDARIALVLRHHDGLLLPDVGAALGRTYAEAEVLLERARDHVRPVLARYDDGTGADPVHRFLQAVPGPRPGLGDRVWDAVEEALLDEYAGEAWAGDAWAGDALAGEAWLGSTWIDDRASAASASWDVGLDGAPPGRETSRRDSARAARRSGMLLLAGAAVLACVLGVMALTAPRPERGGPSGSAAAGGAVPEPSAAPAEDAPDVPDPRWADGQADLVIDAASASVHQPDARVVGEQPTLPALDGSDDTDASVRVRDGTSAVVVRRFSAAGTQGWLVSVQGEVRERDTGTPDVIRSWSVDDGGVVVALQVAGDPDTGILVGLRAGGGGTWLRLPEGTDVLSARSDGSVLCVERATGAVTSYKVLG